MSEPAIKEATYEDLFDLPENMIGQIIDGEIHALPRPSPRHSVASSVLGAEILPPYKLGRGGPGGWLILDEPEIMFGKNLLVPDLAGWRKERLTELPETNWFSIPPDWVCEVLSPSSVRIDRLKKMGIYAAHGVLHVWLIDPVARTFEVFRLESGKWLLLGVYGDADKVRAEPFHEIEIELQNLWWG